MQTLAAREPAVGKGDQQGRRREAAGAASYLHLVLQVREDGSYEVLSATEVPGHLVLPERAVGNFVYEVVSGNRTLAVEALQDPFERRSFVPRDGDNRGHHVDRAPAANVVVKVPNMSLRSAGLKTMTLRMYRITGAKPVEKIDAAGLRALERNHRLVRVLSTPAGKVGRDIQAKGKRVTVD